MHSFLVWVEGANKTLESLPSIEIVDPLVLRILGQNPGKMTLQGTNTYLVGMGKSRILIDCSDGNASYSELLSRVCQEHGVEHISDLLLTHGHLDHMGGIMHIRKLFPGIHIWKYMVDLKSDQSMRLGVRDLDLRKSFAVGTNAMLTSLHAPGHSMDHVCFQLDVNYSLQDNKRRILFTGDCILGTGSTSFTSLQLLLASLRKLKALQSDKMFPGHGPVIVNTKCRINEYIEHRLQREQDILVILRRSKVPIGIDEVTSILYQNVTFLVKMAAKRSVRQHIMKLQEDGEVKVNAQQPTWYFWRPRNLFELIDSTSNGS